MRQISAETFRGKVPWLLFGSVLVPLILVGRGSLSNAFAESFVEQLSILPSSEALLAQESLLRCSIVAVALAGWQTVTLGALLNSNGSISVGLLLGRLRERSFSLQRLAYVCSLSSLLKRLENSSHGLAMHCLIPREMRRRSSSMSRI